MKILSVNASGGIFSEGSAWKRISKIAEMMGTCGNEVHFVHYLKDKVNQNLINQEKYANHTFVETPLLPALLKHLRILKREKYDLVFGFQRIDSGFGVLLALFLLAPVFNVSWLVAEVIRTVKYARQPGRALRFSMPFVAIFFLIESIAINLYIASHARM